MTGAIALDQCDPCYGRNLDRTVDPAHLGAQAAILGIDSVSASGRICVPKDCFQASRGDATDIRCGRSGW